MELEMHEKEATGKWIPMVSMKARLSPAHKRMWDDARGAEIIEFALVVALLLMLSIGLVWAGRAYNIYETINRAAREGARVAVAPSCATCGNAFPSAGAVQGAIDNVLAASNLATSGSGQVTVNIQQGQTLGLDPYNPSATWTVVSITYPFQFTVPFVPSTLSTVNISTQVQMMEE